jgi:hypothetical protein
MILKITPSSCSIFFCNRFVVHDIFFLDFFCARIFFWYLPNPPSQISNGPSLKTYIGRYKISIARNESIMHMLVLVRIFSRGGGRVVLKIERKVHILLRQLNPPLLRWNIWYCHMTKFAYFRTTFAEWYSKYIHVRVFVRPISNVF